MRDEVGGRVFGRRTRLRLFRNGGRYDAHNQLSPSGGNDGGLPDMSRLLFLHSSMAQLRPHAVAAPLIQLDPYRPSSR